MPILDWVDKDKALKAADGAPYRLLEEVPEFSCGDADNENMLIQGDNLDALKALIPYYAGRVKCIFIDPPYNTGSAFEHYDDNLQHSEWLSLMYPRLELLRDLLAEDGTIWMTIDDEESHYLKVICDEVFGRKNFIANAIWQKKYTVANDAKGFSDNHDHLLVFARNKEIVALNRLPRAAEMDKAYKNPDGHRKGVWKSTPLHAKSGTNTSSYTFRNGITWQPPGGTFRRYNDDSMARMDEAKEIWFGQSGKSTPSRKTFLCELKNEGTPPKTIWLHDEVGHNHEAREEIKSIVPQDVFSTPKPERLIDRILILATNPGDLVLDSFLGSGTTAAVAHKMGRKYIGIELGDHAGTHCVPRLQKVIDGEQGGISKACNWNGGGGFRFFRLGKPVFDEAGQIHPDIKFPVLAAHVWFSETHTPWAGRKKSPLLGVHNGVAYYLLYNGILGERSQSGGNVLTSRVLAELPPHDGAKVIYGEWTPFKEDRLRKENIVFKQTPYDVKAR